LIAATSASERSAPQSSRILPPLAISFVTPAAATASIVLEKYPAARS
jgi:hypothetical protein